jgi:hypothetical protein
VITEEELNAMVKSAQENVVGAHESIVRKTNEDVAKAVWGKKVRFNEADIIKFFNRPGGEKAVAGVDVYTNNKKGWGYPFDPKATKDLLIENGVRVTPSYNTIWINANQDLLYAESKKEGHGIILELYCPHERFLEVLRIGRTQSIEFLITGYWGSVASDGSKSDATIYGVLTQVNTEAQLIKCSNGHEFDKDVGHKFCPTCGEPLN